MVPSSVYSHKFFVVGYTQHIPRNEKFMHSLDFSGIKQILIAFFISVV